MYHRAQGECSAPLSMGRSAYAEARFWSGFFAGGRDESSKPNANPGACEPAPLRFENMCFFPIRPGLLPLFCWSYVGF